MISNLLLSGRPRVQDIARLRVLYGVLSIQEDREGAGPIVAAVLSRGAVSWQHRYTIKHARQGRVVLDWRVIRRDLDDIADHLRRDRVVLVHCSAGIHRTGCNGYALLRRLGYTREQAYAEVCRIRPESADCARFLDWADQYLLPKGE